MLEEEEKERISSTEMDMVPQHLGARDRRMERKEIGEEKEWKGEKEEKGWGKKSKEEEEEEEREKE